METNFAIKFEALVSLIILCRWAGGWVGGWVARLTETKIKPNPKLKLELKFGTQLCNNDFVS